MDTPSAALGDVLVRIGVEEKFHAVLAELAGGAVDYLADVAAEDLEGREAEDGMAVSAPTARGLVRKLREGLATPAAAPATGLSPRPREIREAEEPGPACHVSLSRSGAEPSLLRCGLRAELPPAAGGRRHKLLAVVLDRSGSMAGAMWRRVVEAVVGVVTDKLLQDPHVTVALVVYSDDAEEVPVPAGAAELREVLLSRRYSPRGGTCFKAAFELAQRVLERELHRLGDPGVSQRDVDLAVLVFTDGEDTSVKGRAGQYGVRLVDKEASSSAARAAGDAFRTALQRTGCPAYVCMAAFGADHDPGQCQYLSDRYYYINRGEALAEALAGGLGAMLGSAGQCSVRLELPCGVTLEEALPEHLPLDAQGRLDHHVWLRAPGGCIGHVTISVQAAGATVLRGAAALDSAGCPEVGDFGSQLFLVDLVALRLRQVARELCGKRPSADELGGLRARLTDAKERLQPTKEAAGSAEGQLRGRAALRERLAEVEALRERLSYALGQFDERDTNDERRIGSVAIDAILRDAGQHVPQGEAAAALARRAEAAAWLPAPEELSSYGRGYTSDAYSCCDAQELASQGDCLFFQLTGPRPRPDGGFLAAEECIGIVSHEAFVLLSRSGKQAVRRADGEEGFTHLGIPLYATEGHFLRVRLVLPEVLARLSPGGAYVPGVSERQLLSLLGRFLATGPTGEAQTLALMHKARAVRAVLAADVEGAVLLDAVVAEAARFVEQPESRAATADLYAVAAAGLLAEGWTPERLERLGGALCEECLRRRLAHALRGAAETERLYLAWALLGPEGSDETWLDCELPCPQAGGLHLQGSNFDPFVAPEELEALERQSPALGAPRAAGVAALLAILSGKAQDGTPAPRDWSAFRRQLPAWGRAAATVGGIGPLWQCIDAAMTQEAKTHQEELQRAVAALRLPPQEPCLRGAFAGADAVTEIAVAACLPDVKPEGSWRQAVAVALRSVVQRRTALAVKYPITGASFPRLESHTAERVREVWGAPAEPVDPALHHKAMLRVWRRTMNVGISMTVKEALADKEYRKRGGRFAFPSPMDTFVRGLHRRTADLHADWRGRLQRETSGSEARVQAIAEMLLRLRWDDSNDLARARLSQMVGRIWDGLEGLDLTDEPPIPSALWLDDAGVASGSCSPRGQTEATAPAQPAEPAHSEPAPCTAVAAPAAPVTAAAPAAHEAACAPAVPVEPTECLEPAQASELSEPVTERRVARDGAAYTLSEFLEHYGEERGASMWHEALGRRADEAQGEEAGGHESVEGTGGGSAAAAEAMGAAMDAGLLAAFEALPQDVRGQMDAFVAAGAPGSRLKLQASLSAKQRKAVHLWAEERGVQHRSFGYRGRRRLHLSVPGPVAEEEGQAAGPLDAELDSTAWGQQEEPEEWGEEW